MMFIDGFYFPSLVNINRDSQELLTGLSVACCGRLLALAASLIPVRSSLLHLCGCEADTSVSSSVVGSHLRPATCCWD